MSLNRHLWHQPLVDSVSILFRLQQEWLRVSLGPFYLSIPAVLRMDPSLSVAIAGDNINRAYAMARAFQEVAEDSLPLKRKNQISRSGPPRFER